MDSVTCIGRKTEVLFVRHAESDHHVRDDRTRPLTDKGARDASRLADAFESLSIDAIYSSPYLRAQLTVEPLATSRGLTVLLDEQLRERSVSAGWVEDFDGFSKRQWEDFSFRLPGGESLAEVQERNISALREILASNPGRSIVIGTHGTALASILHHVDPSFGYADYVRIVPMLPYVIRMTFQDDTLVHMEELIAGGL